MYKSITDKTLSSKLVSIVSEAGTIFFPVSGSGFDASILEEYMQALANFDQRLVNFDQRLNSIDQRLNSIDQRLNSIDQRLNNTETWEFTTEGGLTVSKDVVLGIKEELLDVT